MLCFKISIHYTCDCFFFTKTANSCRARGGCDFFSLSLQAITKIMQTKEKTRLVSLMERSTLCKECEKFVNTPQEAIQLYVISSWLNSERGLSLALFSTVLLFTLVTSLTITANSCRAQRRCDFFFFVLFSNKSNHSLIWDTHYFQYNYLVFGSFLWCSEN